MNLAHELLNLYISGYIKDRGLDFIDVLEFECISRLSDGSTVYYKLIDNSVIVSYDDHNFAVKD